jgi:hypothetical protein
VVIVHLANAQLVTVEHLKECKILEHGVQNTHGIKLAASA